MRRTYIVHVSYQFIFSTVIDNFYLLKDCLLSITLYNNNYYFYYYYSLVMEEAAQVLEVETLIPMLLQVIIAIFNIKVLTSWKNSYFYSL